MDAKRFRIGRQHNDRHIGIGAVPGGANGTDKLQPVDGLHFPVSNNDIGRRGANFLQGADTIGRLGNTANAETAQNLTQEHAHMGAVIGDEQPQGAQIV